MITAIQSFCNDYINVITAINVLCMIILTFLLVYIGFPAFKRNKFKIDCMIRDPIKLFSTVQTQQLHQEYLEIKFMNQSQHSYYIKDIHFTFTWRDNKRFWKIKSKETSFIVTPYFINEQCLAIHAANPSGFENWISDIRKDWGDSNDANSNLQLLKLIEEVAKFKKIFPLEIPPNREISIFFPKDCFNDIKQRVQDENGIESNNSYVDIKIEARKKFKRNKIS